MDKYKDKRPKRVVLPPRRTRATAQCISKTGTLKVAFTKAKAEKRAHELKMRAYVCDMCGAYHLTKQPPRPEG